MQGRRKNKLWTKIEEIIASKESSAGLVQFRLKIVGVQKPVWVVASNLSAGVSSNFKAGLDLPSNAKAKVDRVVAEEQKTFLQASPASKAKKSRQFKELDPLRSASLCGKWIATAQTYIHAINQILTAKPNERKTVREKLLRALPYKSNYVTNNLSVDHFFSGRLVQWKNEQPVFHSVKDKPGFLRCTVCEKDFKFPALSRVLYHVTSICHHKNCKEQIQKNSSAPSAAVLQEQINTTLGTVKSSLMSTTRANFVK